jgi:MerR family transcriptional regulator, light-induced transcriptional regulator
MRTLKTGEAAQLLQVGPNTLRTWERRFGFPRPARSPGRHRQYVYEEVRALRAALDEGLAISSAIDVARGDLRADPRTLCVALESFAEQRADRVMEASLALRPLEDTVEETLLAAVELVLGRRGARSAAFAFSLWWACSWLARAAYLSRHPNGAPTILIGNATRPDLDPDCAAVAALELLCLRGGASILALPVRAAREVPELVVALRPEAIVLAGAQQADLEVMRWYAALRPVAGEVPVRLFRRPRAGAAVRAEALPTAPRAAAAALLSLVRGSNGNGARLPAR